MEFSYRLNADDYASACRLATQKRSLWNRWTAYTLPVLGAFFVAVSVVASLYSDDWSSNLPVFAVGVFLFALFFMFPALYRRQFKKTPVHSKPKFMTADDEGIRIEIAGADSRSDWTFWTKYAENKKTFILFQQGNRIFLPIAKRELSPEQISELCAIFDAHVKRA